MTFAEMSAEMWLAYDEALLRRHPEWTPDPMDDEQDRPTLGEASGEEET